MVYVALLRGINVGGNNIIPMATLRLVFERLGFDGVRTYINSGNVIFQTSSRSLKMLTADIERAIEGETGLRVATLVKSATDIKRLAAELPVESKNNSAGRWNVLFLWDAIDNQAIVDRLPANPGVDELRYVSGAVFWRITDVTLASKSRMSRIAGTPLYQQLTIRNSNTARKLAELMGQSE